MTSRQVFARLSPPLRRPSPFPPLSRWTSTKATSGVPYEEINTDIRGPPPVDLPSEADVVVIGGGSLGCSALYHLARRGITNTLLLEKDKLTAGTTWHTAGLIWRLRATDTEIQLQETTRRVIMRLEEETGVHPGWINNGGLYVASRKERLDEYKKLMTTGRSQGVESHLLSPEEIKKLYPLMNVQDLWGGLYCPGSGTIEPSGWCHALTRSAKQAGARVFENCPVTDIRTIDLPYEGKKISEVHTPSGVIKTNAVINAAGSWSPYIADMLGIHIPVISAKHGYVVTEKIPGIENMPNVRDTEASVYFRLQGDALSIGGYEPNAVFLGKYLEKDFAFGLFEMDWDAFGAHLNNAIKRIPVLEKIGIKSTVYGPESFTPDHKPVMGEDPSVRGLYHCCGFNSAGMMLGGGCGEQIAAWVDKGRPDLDMFSFDIRRFNPETVKDEFWLFQRTHESYAKNYSIVFPRDEPLAGRNMIKSPLHEVLLEQGCFFQERHGWERPSWFHSSPLPVQEYDFYGFYDHKANTDRRYVDKLEADYTFGKSDIESIVHRECVSCRTKAALFDMSYFGKFYLTGPDSQKAADWIFSGDLSRESGRTVYTCMLNDRGGIEADLTVSIVESGGGSDCDPAIDGEGIIDPEAPKGRLGVPGRRGFYVAVGGAIGTQCWAHIMNEVRTHEWDVQLTDKSHSLALLSVQGPESRRILQSLSTTSFSDKEFPFSSHQVIDLAGHKVRAIRLSFVGELGWELHVPGESAVPVYEAIMEAGKQHGLVNAGYRAIESLACEKGYRHWHADVRSDDSPVEAGLLFTCKLKTETPFLGREAVEAKRKEDPQRKLVTITLNDPSVYLWGQEGLYRNDQMVGYLRRGEYAHTLGRAIGYGYAQVPSEEAAAEFLTAGSWAVEVMGEKKSATSHLKSPFDPTNLRVKGVYQTAS